MSRLYLREGRRQKAGASGASGKQAAEIAFFRRPPPGQFGQRQI
jgi:hypothetical protein